MEHSLWWQVSVPRKIVCDKSLSLRARFLYFLLTSLCAPGETSSTISAQRLVELSTIRTRKSIRLYIQELLSHNYLLLERRPGPYALRYIFRPMSGPMVSVPAYLVQDTTVLPEAKVLYALLDVASPNPPSGLSRLQAQLAQAAGLDSINTVRKYMDHLGEAGWLQRRQVRATRRLSYFRHDAHLTMRRWLAGKVKQRINRQHYKGEAIMKEMLTALIPDVQFEDNARPGYIVNPNTQERLEVDRLYVNQGVGFEFNGPQHYSPTTKFPDPDLVQTQQTRDLVKTALLAKWNMRLITLHPEDLEFCRLQARLRGHLPTRVLRTEDPVIQHLTKRAARYRRRARQWNRKGIGAGPPLISAQARTKRDPGR